MAVLVGIDEAGFGPVLGPLVVSSTAFKLPRTLLQADLWHVLQRTVSQSRRYPAGRLVITDSKKAYSQSAGVRHLERTTLSLLSLLEYKPTSLELLLSHLDASCLPRLRAYPWYARIAEHVLVCDDSDKVVAAHALRQDMARNRMAFLGMASRCLDVGYYNQMIKTVRNKANVLFSVTCTLLQAAWDRHGEDPDFQVVIDRQGGRVHYRDSLLRMFPDLSLAILRENEQMSSYVLANAKRKMRVHFVVKAEARCLPVSLASMVSKYLRELMMQQINNYFVGWCPELKRTAGYWQDGLRFIQDLERNIPDKASERDRLVRCR